MRGKREEKVKAQAKSVALKTFELSKTYSIVLYSSGAVMLRRTAFPYNSISVNKELAEAFELGYAERINDMLESGAALRAAKPAEIKAPIKAAQPAKIDDQEYADYLAFKAFKASMKA